MLSDISYVERSYLLTLARIAETIASNRNAKREDKSKERNGCVNPSEKFSVTAEPTPKGDKGGCIRRGFTIPFNP